MSKCGDGPTKVLGMTACPDPSWRGVFSPVTQDGELWTAPVVVWLLVEHDQDVHLHPAVALDYEVRDATTIGNYLGIVAPGVDKYTVLGAVQ